MYAKIIVFLCIVFFESFAFAFPIFYVVVITKTLEQIIWFLYAEAEGF